MSARQFTIALCIVCLGFHLSSCSITLMKHKKFRAVNWGLALAGHKLNMTPIATTKATNHIKCMTQCTKIDGCLAINLGPPHNGERECEMFNITRYSMVWPLVKFTAKPGWTYVGPKVCPKVRRQYFNEVIVIIFGHFNDNLHNTLSLGWKNEMLYGMRILKLLEHCKVWCEM